MGVPTVLVVDYQEWEFVIMSVIGTCMHCRHGIHSGDTAWSLTVHHERAEEKLRADGSQGVCIEVLAAWMVLYLCEDCMKRHAAEWMHEMVSDPKRSFDDPQSPDATDGES